jgi:hydrogenase nickel incorporation protein HypA/HybF
LGEREAKVLRINLQIGKLSAVVPDSLRFCFQFVAKDTLAENAELAIEEISVTCKCTACASEFTLDFPAFLCPHCGSGEVRLLSGQELFIKSIEIEEK